LEQNARSFRREEGQGTKAILPESTIKAICICNTDLSSQFHATFGFFRREEATIATGFNQLHDFARNGKKIAKGVYMYPFEFILPVSLPSSTQFAKVEGKKFQGRIQYRLHAEMGNSSYDHAFHIVSAPLANNVVPCIAQPTTHELKQAMVLNKGFLSVGACVENSFVGRGEAFKVSVACRNDSSVDVARVRIKVVELIEYKAQDEKRAQKNVLVEIADINLPGLIKCRSNDGLRMSKRRFSETMGSTYQEILQDLTSSQNQFQVSIPENARDTYHGNLISISHYVKITFYTKLSVESPATKVPIVVGSPRNDPGRQVLQRAANEPIATTVADDPPMVEAVVLLPPEQSPNTVFPPDRNVAVVTATVLPYDSDGDEIGVHGSSMPAQSAPDESLLMIDDVRTPPFNTSEDTQRLLERLLRELRTSVHDYEVISSKSRQPGYRELYSSLSPKDLGRIVSNVNMSHQVQVAVLLARQLVMYQSNFTCAHCAEAVKNMVETLLPYCHDIDRNRNLIESELNDWERCVTERVFDDLS
jgi:Arrestin (or S-antigen), C-terminal domain/Arrestin (or S-antigen), N-terminal domain